MLEWLYNALMSIVSFVLGLFGISLGKKSVHFEDGETPGTGVDTPKEDAPVVQSEPEAEAVAKN